MASLLYFGTDLLSLVGRIDGTGAQAIDGSIDDDRISGCWRSGGVSDLWWLSPLGRAAGTDGAVFINGIR